MAQLTVLHKGNPYTILFDDEDLDLVGQYRWCLGSGRTESRYAINGNTGILMHRLIVGLSKQSKTQIDYGREVDHVNGNKLDNRRANLRIVSRKENDRGYKPARGISGHRGVSWDKSRQRWTVGVVVKIDGKDKRHHGGRFKHLEDAIVAAEALREKIWHPKA